MPLPKYTYNGPVDHTIKPDLTRVHGKSVIITGGANGMGEVCVREFVKAGAFVTFADVNQERGKAIEQELNANGVTSAFVKCDIRVWEEQINMFETAKSRSPSKSVDHVIANAGISRSSGDSLWNLDGNMFSLYDCDAASLTALQIPTANLQNLTSISSESILTARSTPGS